MNPHPLTGLYDFIYEFIYIWIHRHINSYNHCMNSYIWNDYMNAYTYEFIYEMNIWIHEYMNSCIWIQMYGFWIHILIHIYMNSEIRIHCIRSEFMNLISLLWIHNMNSLLKIDENSMFWIHDIEFSSEIWHMNIL